jgi:hypothetical protein
MLATPAPEETTTTLATRATVIINPPKHKPTWKGYHAPVAEAPRLHMSSCRDVREIYMQCVHMHSTDDICKAAASYYSICKIELKE